MRAIVWTAYGPPEVLQLQEVEKPVPQANEVLIKVQATTVTAGDCEVRSLKLPMMLGLPMRLYAGLRKPQRIRILGQELAGEIEATGSEVTRFKAGDKVFGGTGFALGAYAEYVCLPVTSEDVALAIKPETMSYEEAATITLGGLEALHFLRLGAVKRGDKLLINGAGGSIGTYGMQLARYYGAEITAVDRGEKLAMLRELGADHVIDYTKEDFTQRGVLFDVIFDVVGKSPYSDSLKSLKPGGRYLIANPRPSLLLRGPWTSARSDKQVIFQSASHRAADLIFLRDLYETGEIRSVIDRRYPLAEMVEAHRYVESGAKQGHVVIQVVS